MAEEPESLPAPFDHLPPDQRERLLKLVEEAAEVIQAAMKIMIHGYESTYSGETNREKLERECGDLRFQMILCCCAGDLDKDHIHAWAHDKGIEIRPYVHHQSKKLLDQAQKAAK